MKALDYRNQFDRAEIERAFRLFGRALDGRSVRASYGDPRELRFAQADEFMLMFASLGLGWTRYHFKHVVSRNYASLHVPADADSGSLVIIEDPSAPFEHGIFPAPPSHQEVAS